MHRSSSDTHETITTKCNKKVIKAKTALFLIFRYAAYDAETT